MAKFRKSVLSQYLRTKCDRQLRLALFEPQELEAKGWPVPLKARPAVQILRDRGIDWENAKLGDLERALPQNLVANKDGDKFREVPLTAALRAGVAPSTAILQGKFGDERLQPAFLTNIGVPVDVARLIPEFVAFQPDILLVQAAGSVTELVLPSGKRASVPAGDQRKAISLCDIKHAGEANSSYSAEVALYAVLLANWLQIEGLDQAYFVSARMGLWTRAKENSTIDELMLAQPGAPLLDRVEAFLKDWELVDFETYFQTVDHFFRHDFPRVLGTADWRDLDWHVDSRCSNCDFLGYIPWLNRADRERLTQNRDHYCVPAAQDCGHLSRVATLTRGGRKTLEEAGHENVAAVAALTKDNNVFDQHNALRADRIHLPHRAAALAARDSSLSEGTVTIDFPKYADLEIFITVNFDPGTGLLTAIGSEGRFRQRVPFGVQTEVKRTWGAEAHVLLDSTIVEERNALISFLSRVAEIFAFVNDPAADRGGAMAARTRCHFYFWDDRQFDELTRAVGRHLHAIVAAGNDRYLRGLIWLFPPEQLLEPDDMVLAHPISAMKRVIQRDVRLPVPHTLTLFGVAEAYHGEYAPSLPGAYYRDPYSDMIPRERIYEIWEKEALVELGNLQRTRAQCISDYSDAVKKQIGALRTVVWKFRADMAGRLQRSARPLQLRAPFNFQNMSEDGRLWLAWVKLEEACQSLETRRGWLAEAEELEASYDILRLTHLVEENGNRATYRVDPACRDCKFRDGESFLALRVESMPGLLNLSVGDAARGHPTLEDNHRPISAVLGAALVSFDRENLRAIVDFESYHHHQAARQELRDQGVVDLSHNVSLVKRMGVSFAERVAECVLAMGRPAISAGAAETYAALGHATGLNAPRNDPATPAGHVVWNAAAIAVEETGVTEVHCSDAIAIISPHWPVNDSQSKAIRHCLTHRLSVVWGPPGTGKTTTAAAYVVARILAARAAGSAKRILITGPTYTAFEKLFGEVCQLLAALRITDIPSYRVYSSFHGDREPLPAGYLCRDVVTTQGPAFTELAEKLAARDETILVGTVVQQCYRIADMATGLASAEYFDVMVMDESSQIDVSSALYALSLLANGFELTLFGDHLQMPPVVQTQAPRGAEWLVGSVQTYLLHRHRLGKIPLLINYRSSRAFVEFARRIEYPQELTSHSPDLALRLLLPATAQPAGWSGSAPWFPGLADIVNPARALTALTYADGRAGQANEFEADLACSAVQQLFYSASASLAGKLDADGTEIVPVHRHFGSEDFWQSGIGIVTPHRAQRAVIVRKLWAIFPLHRRDLIDSAVDTVERFQGGERDSIVISFGVGDPDLIAAEEEFLLKLERINVAISRARAKCILCISDDLAYHLPSDRETIATARAVKCYVNTFCQPRKEIAVPAAAGTTRTVWVRD